MMLSTLSHTLLIIYVQIICEFDGSKEKEESYASGAHWL